MQNPATTVSEEQVSEEVVNDFKSLTRQLIHMIREAVQADTAIMYWVNHSRKQLVLAGSSTQHMNTLFQDRIGFDDHFLKAYLHMQSSALLQVERDISSMELDHYFNGIPIDYIALFPLRTQGETIAILQVEFAHKPDLKNLERTEQHLKTYSRVLNNYMQLTELQRDEEGWREHDRALDKLAELQDVHDLTHQAIELIAQASEATEVLYFSQHNLEWTCVDHLSKASERVNLIGALPSEDSFSYEIIQEGSERLTVQSDQKPRLVHVRENFTNQSCLGLPVKLRGRHQGAFLVVDPNPYLLNDIKRHKLRDIVRTLELRLQIALKDIYEPYLCNSHQLIHDHWVEKLAYHRLSQLEDALLVMISLKNISHFRVNQNASVIENFRRDIIRSLMPFSLGLSGLATEHADFVYEIVLAGCPDSSFEGWSQKLRDKLQQVFAKYFPAGREKPEVIIAQKALRTDIDWLQQKRLLL